LEVIAAVGPSRQFLAEPHTLKYLRQEFFPSKLATRLNPEAWMEAGAKDSAEVAAGRVKAILSGAPEVRLEPHVVAELSHIVALAEKQTGNPA
jgi:trimethylamine--corrinoid protein Co-methyltransferase